MQSGGGVQPRGSARKGYLFQASEIWEVGILLVEVSVIVVFERT